MKNEFNILVPVMIIILLSLIGYGNHRKTWNKGVALLKYKGLYAGGNSPVASIIAMLSANVYSAGFRLQTNERTYGVIIED